VPADTARRCEIYNFDTSCTNAKAKYSSSVVSPDPSVHFYHCVLVVYAEVKWLQHITLFYDGFQSRHIQVKTVLNVCQMFVELHLISPALRE